MAVVHGDSLWLGISSTAANHRVLSVTAGVGARNPRKKAGPATPEEQQRLNELKKGIDPEVLKRMDVITNDEERVPGDHSL